MFDFDKITDRRGTLSYKWDDTAEGVLPMWVADMDFPTAPAVIDALRKRIDNGCFGYTLVPEEYYTSVVDWFERRHGWHIDREMMIYTSGVVPAISAIIKALTEEGDKVIVQTPVFNCFFSSIRNNGCEILANPLLLRDDTFFMDFDDLERKAADPKAKILLLCNPHNPAGRVWTREELTRLGEICIRHNVMVVSDEIHCEFVFKGYRFTPFASISGELSAHSIVCISPSKAFNIAGLQIANIVAPDAATRAKIDRAININEVCDVNPFGVIATIAAYNHGEEWLRQLLDYIEENYHYFKRFCGEHFPGFPVIKLEGTYLAWMDCRKTGLSSDLMERLLEEEAKLKLNAGTMYGPEGEGFMRWNLACPRALLKEGLNRFLTFLQLHHLA